jgi:Uma2 family endonuclease
VAVSLRLAVLPGDHEILELGRRNPGLQIEQNAAGELILTPVGSETGHLELALGSQLYRWADLEGSGLAFGASSGFRLPDGSLLCPDASWLPRRRWEALTARQREGFVSLCPDAVFELASRSNTLSELRAKMRTYLANGARVAVLIDPGSRVVEVHMPGREVQILESPKEVALDPVLPGFTLDLEPIF